MRHAASVLTTVPDKKFWTSSRKQQERSEMFSVIPRRNRTASTTSTRRDLTQIRHDQLRKVGYYPRPT